MFFGVGPAQFVNVWSSARDTGINESLFWDTDFAFGVGVLPTFFITTGLIGGLAWLLLIGAWGYGAIQFVRTRPQDSMVHATTLVWLTASGYLLALFALYVPSVTLLALMGIALGAFVSALTNMHLVNTYTFSTQQSTLAAFAMPTTLGLISLAVCVLFVQGIRPVIASAYETRASYVLSQNDTARAQILADRATALYASDDSAQVKTAVAFAVLGKAAEDAQKTQDKDAVEQLKPLVETAIGNAQDVVRFDARSFRNWLFLANAYEQVSGIVGQDALKSAHTAYDEAQKRSPNSPLVPLLRARLQFAEKDVDGARKSIADALALKQNYTDAYFLLSQIEIQEGNGPEAIQSTQSAILLAPNNPGLRFQLGFLLYASGDYENAVRVLETAVTLNADYANALYFLGLSYDRLGKTDEAKTAFAKVLALNPTNEEVKAIVAGLDAGTPAVETLKSLQQPAPAERDVLPVSDSTSSMVQ
jgi:tetratricopeptide (TPR) repeat protein